MVEIQVLGGAVESEAAGGEGVVGDRQAGRGSAAVVGLDEW